MSARDKQISESTKQYTQHMDSYIESKIIQKCFNLCVPFCGVHFSLFTVFS